MPLTIGTRLGPYEIVSPLGAGGMGEVYRARDTRLDRDVAIKVVSSTRAGDPLWRERFDREARAISGLNHPHICTLYDVGHQDGVDFLVMEYLDGETLADRLRRSPLPLEETLRIGVQLADALGEAHRQGFIHRDIKPANVFLTTRGDAKILDFGLAKITVPAGVTASAAETADLDMLTGAGAVVGTIVYMSPEQMRGLPVDPRTDLFSFGVVLYEMVTRERPFSGSSAIAVADAVLHAEPRDFGDTPVPGRLKSLIRKLLEKDPAKRYQSADGVRNELKALEAAISAPTMRLSKVAWVGAAAVAVVLLVAGGWFWRKSSRERWAREATANIDRLVEAGQFTQAAAQTRDVRLVLPNDPTLDKLWLRETFPASIDSVPAGADVAIQPYPADGTAWEHLGATPLKNIRITRNMYVCRITRTGFAPLFFIFGTSLAAPPGGRDYSFATTITSGLRPEGSVPPGMVVVLGGTTGLGPPYGQLRPVQVDGFLIDQHEVTNEEYKTFVDAGGYQRREFWKQPFVKDGRTISWDEAVSLFRDTTGRPGPAIWEAGSYPKGLEKHPVAGVSWFEAAAYAEFVGKTLPTVYHWTQASKAVVFPALIANGSNFSGSGTQSVGGHGTLGSFGTTDMAGNVKEWCLNEGREGRRFILGGGFGDEPYMFIVTDLQSPWDRRPNFGFRCAKLDGPAPPASTAKVETSFPDFSKDTPISADVFKAYQALYAYDKQDLNARVEETVTTGAWRHEKVSFDAAYGHERVPAHLYLPTKGSPPFQVVVYFPGAFAMLDDSIAPSAIENALNFLPSTGRALMFPIYKGFYERRDGLQPGGQSPPAFFRDHVIMWAKDLSRSLDYLQSRPDIDGAKIAYLGLSLGAQRAPVFLAVEPRFRAAILQYGGLVPRHDLPEVDVPNFAPFVHIPVLMLNGKYEAATPLESSQRPMFRLLGTPEADKKHLVYDVTELGVPRQEEIRQTLDWLDKYLGPVRH